MNISSHCLLVTRVSNKKPSFILLSILCMWCITSLLLLSRFYLFLALDVLILIYLDTDLFEFILLRVHWAVYINVCHQIWEFWAIISSNILSALSLVSSWDAPYDYVGTFYGVPWVSKVLLIFLHSFLFLGLDHFSSQVHWFFCLLKCDLLLRNSNEILISAIMLLNFRIFIWFIL